MQGAWRAVYRPVGAPGRCHWPALAACLASRQVGAMRTVGNPDLARLAARPRGALSTEDIREAGLLEGLVRQAIGAGVPIDVVPMDEYRHDVLMVLSDALVLVFDTT